MKNINELKAFIANKEILLDLGSFDEYDCFNFTSDEVRNDELNKFDKDAIKDLYLERFNPVLHFKLDKTNDNFTAIAFESLINWNYC